MTRFQSTLRRFLCLASALLISLPPAQAIDASDMDPHLPDTVILAAMRFRAFARKVDDQKEWDKKHSELMILLKAELEKASLNDNRAATALRTLISDLKDAKYFPQKKPAKEQKGEYPVLPNGTRVMVKESFHINKAESRVLTYPFEVKSVPAMITIGIGGGSDDSNDRGLHYLLIDPVGRVIKRGFSDVDEYVWFEHQCTRGGKWRVIIEDLDTDLRSKKSPGNRGAIEVLVKAE
ncbi:MAG: hypothetical protein ACI8XO_003470 [Verrucomicrobiales bacterium]|jgi:hypothetical protein